MRKKGIITAVLAISAVCLFGTGLEAAYAAEGWTKEGGQWSYLNEKGEPETDVWRQSGEYWFYLDGEGRMVNDCFVRYRSGLYYVNEDGRRVQSDWVHVPSDKDGQEAGWYYFGADGKAFCRSGRSFKKVINGQTYIFNEEGKMLRGWMDGDGRNLETGDNPLTEGVYYSGEDGAVYTESWMNYNAVNETEPEQIESMESYVSGRPYTDYGELWMYFDKSSRRVRSKGERLKQKEINGGTYGFDENGIMLSGWSRVASISNADKSNPTSSEPARFYAGYDGGSLLRNTWFWMYPSDSLDSGDYKEGEYSWWYAGDNGKVYQNKIRNINGKRYAFDGLGRMRTGFVMFEGRSEFVAQYDPQTWSSEDFKNGDIYGSEKADLYFFSPDELNDGSMQKGDDLQVELGDGIHTFGFGSNGIAYGNRNSMERVRDGFYINGLKLTADNGYGYGIVQADEEGAWHVVDTQGKQVKGKRKVIRDREEGWLMIINNRFAARVEDESKPRWHNGDEGPGFYHYDSQGKKIGDFIAGYHTPADLSGVPDEQKLYFK